MRPGEKIKCMGGLLFTVFRFTRLFAYLAWEYVQNVYTTHDHQHEESMENCELVNYTLCIWLQRGIENWQA